MKKKAVLCSLGLSAAIVLGGCNSEENASSGEEENNNQQASGEQEDTNSENTNNNSSDSESSTNITEAAEPYSEETTEGDPIVLEGEVVYVLTEQDSLNPFEEISFNVLTDAADGEEYITTVPSPEDVELGDIIKVYGSYQGADDRSDIPLVNGELLEVTPSSEQPSLTEMMNFSDDNLAIGPDESSGGSTDTTYYAEFTNESNEYITVEERSVTFYDDNDEVAKVVEGVGIDTFPEIVAPGETGYIEYWEPGLEGLSSAEPYVSPVVAPDFLNELSVESDNLRVEQGDEQPSMSITGEVLNNTGSEVSEVIVYSVLRDDQGDLVGVESGYIETPIAPDETRGYEISGQYFPPAEIEKIDSIETRAYSPVTSDFSY